MVVEAAMHMRGLKFRVDPAVTPRLSGDPAPLRQRIPACEAVAIEMQDEGLVTKEEALLQKVAGALRLEAAD